MNFCTWIDASPGGHGSDIRSEHIDCDIMQQPSKVPEDYLQNYEQFGSNVLNFSLPSAVLHRSLSTPVSSNGPGMGMQASGTLPHNGFKEVETGSPGTPGNKGPDVILRLSALLVEIQEAMHTLQDSQWACTIDPEGLKKYPVGSALQLAHDFSLILQDLPRATSARPSALGGLMGEVPFAPGGQAQVPAQIPGLVPDVPKRT